MFKPSKRIENVHKEGVWAVSWCGTGLLTGALDGTTKVWTHELKAGGQCRTRSMGVTSIGSFKDGSRALSCCQDGTISIFDVPSMSDVYTISAGPMEAWTACLSPTETLIAAGSHSGAIKMYSGSEFATRSEILTHCGFITNLSFNDDATKVASVGMDGALNVVDAVAERIIHKIDAHALPVRSVKFMHDANLVLTASDDRHVCAFDARTATPINSFAHAGMALCLDVSADHKHFAVGCSNHAVSIWDIGMQRNVHLFDSQHSEPVFGVSFSQSGQILASVGDDALLQLYEC